MATITSSNLPNPPLFIQKTSGLPLEYSGTLMRNLINAAWPRSGIIGNGYRLWQNTVPDWSISVESGYAVVGATGEWDRYLVVSHTRFNISLSGWTAPLSGTRTHRVFLCVYDYSKGGPTDQYAARFKVTEDVDGTGAPTPDDLPAHYLELGKFTVTAGQTTITTANITQLARRASAGFAQVPLSLATGFQSAVGGVAGTAPVYHINGSRVFFEGVVERTSGNFVSDGTQYTIATLPNAYWPTSERHMVGTSGGHGLPYRLTVTAAGLVIVKVPSVFSEDASWVSLGGCSYEID